MKTSKRNTPVILITIILLISFYNCQNTQKKFIATYRIDKTIRIDTSIQIRQRIDSSYGWTIYLRDENIFEFRGSNLVVIGNWQMVDKNNNDHFIDFQFADNHITGRLNDNIIYFDKPNLLLDSLFKHAIFVRLNDN